MLITTTKCITDGMKHHINWREYSLISKYCISNGNRQNIELRKSTTVVFGDETTRSSAAVLRILYTLYDVLYKAMRFNNKDLVC
jgi:hypothetical protein